MANAICHRVNHSVYYDCYADYVHWNTIRLKTAWNEMCKRNTEKAEKSGHRTYDEMYGLHECGCVLDDKIEKRKRKKFIYSFDIILGYMMSRQIKSFLLSLILMPNVRRSLSIHNSQFIKICQHIYGWRLAKMHAYQWFHHISSMAIYYFEILQLEKKSSNKNNKMRCTDDTQKKAKMIVDEKSVLWKNEIKKCLENPFNALGISALTRHNFHIIFARFPSAIYESAFILHPSFISITCTDTLP